MTVLAGLDVLLQQRLGLIAGRRMGLISNASGVTHDLVGAVDALWQAPGVELRALFGPEHGFAAAVANGARVGQGVDPATGLAVYSLYGEVRRPTPEMLAGLDVLVYDIQSVGVRFYTYNTTLLYSMQAAAERGLALIVCDRPNPIGGEVVEGPLLEGGFESFVGPGAMPIRHGMTIGEFARWANAAWGIGCDLTVVPCLGWRRAMRFDDTGLPWVSPSPAIPWPATTIVYPGTCLIEGTNLSEGRGTALPFHLIGSPWAEGRRLAEAMNRLDLPGVRFRPARFEPSAGKWAGQPCEGVQLHISDGGIFRPVTAGLHLLATARALYPEQFAWRVSGEGRRPYIDLLAGTDQVRRALDDGVAVDVLLQGWAGSLEQFVQATRPYYLYDG